MNETQNTVAPEDFTQLTELHDIVLRVDPDIGFRDTDYAILIGAKPRLHQGGLGHRGTGGSLKARRRGFTSGGDRTNPWRDR